jgi:hypothetical protein
VFEAFSFFGAMSAPRYCIVGEPVYPRYMTCAALCEFLEDMEKQEIWDIEDVASKMQRRLDASGFTLNEVSGISLPLETDARIASFWTWQMMIQGPKRFYYLYGIEFVVPVSDI